MSANDGGPRLDDAAEVARLGAEEALKYFRAKIEVTDKAEGLGYDPVTEGDRAAERVMRAEIERRFSSHGILGEEYGERSGTCGWRWVLDPIDGTRGFVSGTPAWMTLVGVELEGVPTLGAMVQPFTGEVWTGGPEGAFHTRMDSAGGERRIEVSGRERLAEARIATTDPRARPQGPMTDREAEAFLRLAAMCPVARFGLDAYAYGLLALGTVDLVVESGLQAYDVSAVLPVVRAAGGVATSWTGDDPAGGGTLVAAASPRLHASACAALAQSRRFID